MSRAEAINWIKTHGFHTLFGIDETLHTYRFRQHDPRKFVTFHNKELKDHIGFVVLATIKKSE